MRFIYSCLFRFLLPLILVRSWWRNGGQFWHRLGERFGRVPARASRAPLIWLHAVSVGETLAAVPLIVKLASRHPNWQWLVTTTTVTGSGRVRAELSPLLGERLLHYYLPYDLPSFIDRFITALRPRVLIIMETELWPNLLARCSARKIPTLLANGRLSAKSAAGYKKFAGFTASTLQQLSVVVAQYSSDGERFVALGVPRQRMVISGNIKFDIQLDSGLISATQVLAHQWRGASGRRVWLAASTHSGEDEQVLEAFTQLLLQFPDLLLVLVPRHPQRFNGVARLVRQRQLRLCRRSDDGIPNAAHQVLLGDTMGELLRFYGASDVAFVGGSLVPVGGHNMIEAAAWNVPIVCGPQLFNFAAVADRLCSAGGMVVVQDSAGLAAQVSSWLKDDVARRVAGECAHREVEKSSGALQRLALEVEALLARQSQ
ncbi:MAG: lipid IV(A) 3-deoxy-D-manno-octulosonic acid transferase [Gammaproteobacteria bacterium]|nr:lipid IV(A) 3-deoxy-D-manno-octulosonic acid transferase [Gammaproteobacteria bacterium]